MKRFSKWCLIGLLGISLGTFNSRADLEVSGSVEINATADFYAPLDPYGAWIEVGTYGRCWRPAHVAVEWQPYCYGHWVWTDCGWYWFSDEPWAWACYHYGSWVLDPGYGWLWVPGIEWGPAWVSWRFGGGYCGWAPLGPRGIVVAPRSFVFVEVGRFHDPVRPSTVIVNNTTIINKTTVVGGVKHENRNFGGSTSRQVVVNQGPDVAVIEKATRQKFSAVPIRDAASRTPVPSEAARKIDESRKSGKPEAAPGRAVSPGGTGEERKAVPSSPPNAAPTGKPQGPGSVGSPPAHPTAPNAPSEKPSKPGKGKGKDKGNGKGGD